MAAEALGKLGDERAIPYLADIIKEEFDDLSNDWVHRMAAEALGHLGVADALPALRRLRDKATEKWKQEILDDAIARFTLGHDHT
jgi:HEAT repeat protein